MRAGSCGGMKRLAKQAAQLLFVLWAVVTILFFIFRLMPGNPLRIKIGLNVALFRVKGVAFAKTGSPEQED